MKRLLILLFLFSVVLWGCSDDEPNDFVTAPEIPPVTTLLIDFSDFNTTMAKTPNPSDPILSRQNWNWAVWNVGVWNTFIALGMAVPVAAFAESFNHEPTRQPDGSWVWDYDFYVGGAMHLAELSGRVDGSMVHWEMHISKQNEYTDFLWFEGDGRLDVTAGEWTIYTSPDDAQPLVSIDWHRTVNGQTWDITYTNIYPGGAEYGGYIAYGVTTADDYDAYYDIFNQGQSNLTEIDYNRMITNGRIKDANHFGDSDWHCWDANQDDVDCPE